MYIYIYIYHDIPKIVPQKMEKCIFDIYIYIYIYIYRYICHFASRVESSQVKSMSMSIRILILCL